jgi:hypothetical protein
MIPRSWNLVQSLTLRTEVYLCHPKSECKNILVILRLYLNPITLVLIWKLSGGTIISEILPLLGELYQIFSKYLHSSCHTRLSNAHKYHTCHTRLSNAHKYHTCHTRLSNAYHGLSYFWPGLYSIGKSLLHSSNKRIIDCTHILIITSCFNCIQKWIPLVGEVN